MAKYIRFMSDLHLEFRKDPLKTLEIYCPPLDEDDKTVMVLAGDIGVNRGMLKNVLADLRDKFTKVIYIPGNHEFYQYNDISEWEEDRRALVDLRDADRIFVGSQSSLLEVDLGNCVIIATTLWADGGKTPVENMAVSQMNDFRQIEYGGRRFEISDMQALNKIQSKQIRDYLATATKPVIVATHHLPSYALCDPKYSPSPYDGLFASEQSDLFFDDKAPKVWIFGHTHVNIDRIIGNTRLMANPLGYPGEPEVNFNPTKLLLIEELIK